MYTGWQLRPPVSEARYPHHRHQASVMTHRVFVGPLALRTPGPLETPLPHNQASKQGKDSTSIHLHPNTTSRSITGGRTCKNKDQPPTQGVSSTHTAAKRHTRGFKRLRHKGERRRLVSLKEKQTHGALGGVAHTYIYPYILGTTIQAGGRRNRTGGKQNKAHRQE